MAVLDSSGIFANRSDQQVAEAAIEKLHQTKKGDLKDAKAKAFFQPTLEILIDFCQQDVRFAHAVLDEKKNLAECLNSISKTVGSAFSDLDVYRKAVQYYLPDAQISMQISIYLGSETVKKAEPSKASSSMILNLFDF